MRYCRRRCRCHRRRYHHHHRYTVDWVLRIRARKLVPCSDADRTSDGRSTTTTTTTSVSLCVLTTVRFSACLCIHGDIVHSVALDRTPFAVLRSSGANLRVWVYHCRRRSRLEDVFKVQRGQLCMNKFLLPPACLPCHNGKAARVRTVDRWSNVQINIYIYPAHAIGMQSSSFLLRWKRRLRRGRPPSIPLTEKG